MCRAITRRAYPPGREASCSRVAFGLELDARGPQRTELLFGRRRKLRVGVDERVHEYGTSREAREPLVIRRDHVPRRPPGARMAEHLGERDLIVVPPLTLGYVGGRKLPVLLRRVDAREEPLTLLLVREVEEQLHDHDAILDEVPLPIVDLRIAALPQIPLER